MITLRLGRFLGLLCSRGATGAAFGLFFLKSLKINQAMPMIKKIEMTVMSAIRPAGTAELPAFENPTEASLFSIMRIETKGVKNILFIRL
jgi:hypothetical protein